jgi:hypothetical protein
MAGKYANSYYKITTFCVDEDGLREASLCRSIRSLRRRGGRCARGRRKYGCSRSTMTAVATHLVRSNVSARRTSVGVVKGSMFPSNRSSMHLDVVFSLLAGDGPSERCNHLRPTFLRPNSSLDTVSPNRAAVV